MFDLFKRKAADDERKSWRERLAEGLGRSREKLSGALASAFSRRTLDDETLEALESALLTADVGVAATQHLLDDLKSRWKRAGAEADPHALLKAALVELLSPLEQPLVVSDARPFVIMLAGVNGAGKTTSIGKLAKHFQDQGLSVLLAAGDTFRAAAREQLAVWGERNGVAVISQQGGDPAAVMFDAVARGEGARYRRRPRRHRGPAADPAAPDGRDPQGPAGHRARPTPARRTRRCWCSTPTPGRTRWRR